MTTPPPDMTPAMRVDGHWVLKWDYYRRTQLAQRPNREPSISRDFSQPRHSHSSRNTRYFPVTHVLQFPRGLQPPPQDKRKLRKELTRLNYAIRILHGRRADAVVLLDRYDRRLTLLRRERDAYANALQDMDPEAYASAEEERREWDDPKKALSWSQRGGGDRGGEP